MPAAPAHSRASRTGRALLLLAWAWSGLVWAAPAEWFPDPPNIRRYVWNPADCASCRPLNPEPAWTRMADLAGVVGARFLLAADERQGHAYVVAPDRVVLSPAALKLEPCHLAFVVGHELAHLARRHFDEDAIALSVYSGLPADRTVEGAEVMQLVDWDFGLALRVSHLWQAQEDEADWLGAQLAAQARGCSLEAGALAYLARHAQDGGGLAAAHAPSRTRALRLLPFSESVRHLGKLAPP